MIDTSAKVAQLASLLRDPTPEGRRALLDGVMELYAFGSEACSEAAREEFGHLLGDLSRLVDMDARADLAVHLTSVARAPGGLVEQLANDVIEVAAPLLVHSRALSDATLAAIIDQRGGEHAAAIALRAGLPADLAGQILRQGYGPALARLVENPQTDFTRQDFDVLLAAAGADRSLQVALIERADLPADIALKLLWHVSPALSWQALQCAFAVDGDLLAHALEVSATAGISQAGPVDHPADALSFAHTKDRRRELKEPLIVRLLRDGEMDSFYACLDVLAGIDRATAQEILSEPGGYPLAVACKAAGFARSTFSTLLRLSDYAESRDLHQTFALMNVFDAITPADAQRLTGYWQVVFSGADLAGLPSENLGRKAS